MAIRFSRDATRLNAGWHAEVYGTDTTSSYPRLRARHSASLRDSAYDSSANGSIAQAAST
eukprot:CAMPEP_0182939880 /NCGR_PEP_ID=MMETSP0105_2-20130417/46413_1 /TAXON_ID=81532 ORGANISM="Acanthoeca-like sp., Strain 10tr" /NCGR_SAMPLE_ID=MMETSP0105_2 /ASSEMBLY_ACC=CAM_ASM_000205 /LENGTH=59 /DNA_ID=CAMNT_0025079331 /DNA_START=22 /DNA_END=198 /DNA_ORIENTATION=-